MTRAEAIRKIMKVLGPKAYWRVGDKVTSPERRRAFAEQKAQIEFEAASLHRDMKARADAVLAADTEYQELKAAWNKAQTRERNTDLYRPGYRFEVGTRESIYTKPMAYGDTWEEVFEKLESQAKAKAS